MIDKSKKGNIRKRKEKKRKGKEIASDSDTLIIIRFEEYHYILVSSASIYKKRKVEKPSCPIESRNIKLSITRRSMLL